MAKQRTKIQFTSKNGLHTCTIVGNPKDIDRLLMDAKHSPYFKDLEILETSEND